MRYLGSYVTCLLSGLSILACTSPADVATRSDADVGGGANVAGNANVGGSNIGQGGTQNATGGTANGVAGTGDDIEIIRSPEPPITNPAITDEEYAAFIGDSNTFGLDLQQRLVAGQNLATQNIVFSPASAQLALAMAYGAAIGETAAGMKTALYDNLGPTKYHAGCNRLLRDLASRNYTNTDAFGYTRRIELTPANALWTDRTVAIRSTYLDLLGQHYDSGMRRVDFIGQSERSRLAINAWVEDKTHDLIKNLLSQADITTDTRFVLVNALYFYGSWASTFDKQATKAGTFQALSGTDVSASIMHQTLNAQYKAAGDVQVLQLPYATGDLWMTFVLPAAGQFEATRAAISATWLGEATSSLASTYVAVTLPKYKIETDQLPLVDSLKAMGMKRAFETSAEFDGMTDLKPLFISQVVQKAFVSVDEDGTEAAAATAVVGGTVSIPPPPVPVVFDRPFLFFIQDKSGLVLFSGQVVDPTK